MRKFSRLLIELTGRAFENNNSIAKREHPCRDLNPGPGLEKPMCLAGLHHRGTACYLAILFRPYLNKQVSMTVRQAIFREVRALAF